VRLTLKEGRASEGSKLGEQRGMLEGHFTVVEGLGSVRLTELDAEARD
jgi:hypothetical protein